MPLSNRFGSYNFKAHVQAWRTSKNRYLEKGEVLNDPRSLCRSILLLFVQP